MTTTRARRLQPVVRPARPRLRSGLLAAGTGAAVAIAGLVVWTQAAPIDVDGSQALPPASPVVAEGEDDDGEVDATDDGEVIEALPLVTYELFLARDPFEPVVPEPEPEPEPAPDPSDPDAPFDPDDPAAPVLPGDPLDPSDPNGPVVGGNCTSSEEVVCDGRVFSVVEIAEENGEPVAVLQVDTMRYRVAAGDVVLEEYEVLSVSPDEVRLLIDDRVVGVLVGDNALK